MPARDYIPIHNRYTSPPGRGFNQTLRLLTDVTGPADPAITELFSISRPAVARERVREETWARVAPLLIPRRQAELDPG